MAGSFSVSSGSDSVETFHYFVICDNSDHHVGLILFLFQDFDCIAQSLILHIVWLMHSHMTTGSTLIQKLSVSVVLDDNHFLAHVLGWICWPGTQQLLIALTMSGFSSTQLSSASGVKARY
ncbi:TPA: hypothetical protein ACH3X3_000217 [Trebouxia sp. C0006]